MGSVKYSILIFAFAKFLLAKLLTPILVAIAFFFSETFFSFLLLEKSLYIMLSFSFILSFWLAAIPIIFLIKLSSFSIFFINKVMIKRFSEIFLKAYVIIILLLINRFFLKFEFRLSFLLPRLLFLITPFIYIFATQILTNIILIK